MSETSPILGLPYIQPAQAQKHVTHNEAIQMLDALVQLVVIAQDQTAPPNSAQSGARYIVATGGQGDWADHDGDVAVYNGNGWIFLTPQRGWTAYVTDTESQTLFDGTSWSALSSDMVDRLGINTSADDTNRLSVSSDAVLLNHNGTGHQLKVNKAANVDTASLLFQTGFSGRAEMGTAGNDDFSIKVSADGTTWTEALRIDAATGQVDLLQSGLREVLLAPRTYFVDPANGNDSNTGLIAVTDAFATLDAAIAAALALDGAGHDVTIQLADATYAIPTSLMFDTPLTGIPILNIVGNLSAPEMVVMSATREVFEVRQGTLALSGMRLQTTSSSLALLNISGRGTVTVDAVDFGVAGGHVTVSQFGMMTAVGDYSISGDAKYHVRAEEGGYVSLLCDTIDILGTPDFSSSFAVSTRGSILLSSKPVFQGTATGRRYAINNNGVISTNGNGETYFPGDSAGFIATGGQYS